MGRTRAAHSPLLARAQGKAPAAAVGRRNAIQIPKLVGAAGRTMHRVDLPERGGLTHGMAAPDQRVASLRTELRHDLTSDGSGTLVYVPFVLWGRRLINKKNYQ